jgi:hypothetical protein
MSRKHATTGTLLLLAAWLCGRAAVAPAVGLEVLGLPSPGDVVKVLDALTRKDSDTSVEVKLGETVSQGKLLVARTRVEVDMERSSRNWRGPVRVHMTVPSAVSYSINLAAIRPEHVRVDAVRRLLVVTMPEPQVEEVTPLLNSLKSEDTFKGCRFRRLDGDSSRELQNVMLKEDYQARARKEAEAGLPQVRERARFALQDLLESLLRPGNPSVRVWVE